MEFNRRPLTRRMASALTGEPRGQALLEEMARRDLFLHRIDENGGWYLYHHMFAEFLRQRLERVIRSGSPSCITSHRTGSAATKCSARQSITPWPPEILGARSNSSRRTHETWYVVFAQAFHHLPPATAVRAIAEATRVGNRFLVIDLERQPPMRLLVMSLLMAPVAVAMLAVRSSFRHMAHDGFISALRSCSRSGFTALGKAAHPAMRIEFLSTTTSSGYGPKSVAIVFSRPAATAEPTNATEHETRQSGDRGLFEVGRG
ncbi:hypothetical protein [Nocardia sp. NPDC050412]|uniref:hypothetical protein n=1 Tax=Nocardia sp. NPDC050412 TaxID=3364320 RepID=UPI003797536F